MLVFGTGETWRSQVKDILMGKGFIKTPRGKFHKADDVAALFADVDHSAPEPFAKSAWWFFAGITTPGSGPELERALASIVLMLDDVATLHYPFSEGDPVAVDEALLEDLARLWPPLVENA